MFCGGRGKRGARVEKTRTHGKEILLSIHLFILLNFL